MTARSYEVTANHALGSGPQGMGDQRQNGGSEGGRDAKHKHEGAE
jgi:hypothetical protein